ncbi:SNARE associated Golgi protein family [Artemisia annua]|uniref:SNARE associated Golgi protein family n=1 Tax=Artemisia annua TaxID=35608 RepID=A0A2U1MYM0_ARTAN|nr:SNARE associated Golgi protein family [Artemisia annua]
MEKSLLAMAWELEKLHVEMATVKKRAHAPAPTSNPNPSMQLDAFKMKYTSVFALHIPVDELRMSCLGLKWDNGPDRIGRRKPLIIDPLGEVIPILNWETETFSKPVLAVLIFASVALFPTIFLPSTPSMWVAGMSFGYGFGFLLIIGGCIIGTSLPYVIGSLFYHKNQASPQRGVRRQSPE